jgi:flagellar basal body-associated protein FliL
MKQQISPVVGGLIVVVVAAVLGFAGYKLFLSSSNRASTPVTEEQKKAMEAVKPENMAARMQAMRRSGGPPRGMMGNNSSNPMAPR